MALIFEKKLQEKQDESTIPTKSFAFLIPAHNEEKLIGESVGSIHEVEYPKSLFDIYVIADNCTDSTAQIATQKKAFVMERFDPKHLSKGAALDWAIKQLTRKNKYDAFIITDADSCVSKNFLKVMDFKLGQGAQVIQAFNTIANSDNSWVTRLTHVAFTIQNYLKPLACSKLGISSGLFGNGMCFSSPLLETPGWSAFSLREDLEFHIHLVKRGIKTEFAPLAVVYSDAPQTLSEARSQRIRWERGKFLNAWHHAVSLLVNGLRRRDFSMINTSIDLLVPPFTLIFLLMIAILVIGLALTPPIFSFSRWLAFFIGLNFLVLLGLARANTPLKGYFSFFLHLPVFFLWKIWVFYLAFGGKSNRWIRTPR